MIKLSNVFIGLLICFCLFNCGGNQRAIQDMRMEKAEESVADEPVSNSASQSPKQGGATVENPIPKIHKSLKIIKTANLRYEVEDLLESTRAIHKFIKKYEAYSAGLSQSQQYTQSQCQMEIRVASSDFEKLLTDLEGQALHIDTKEVEARDVTEEYVDLETRIQTKKKVEERYISLLAKAQKIEEILKIENQLRIIREEIEAKEGRLKYLKDQVRYSTIYLEMYQNTEPRQSINQQPSFGAKLQEGFINGWQGVLTILVGLAYAWPIWVIIGILIFIFRRKKSNAHTKGKAD